MNLPERDKRELASKRERIRDWALCGGWFTIAECCAAMKALWPAENWPAPSVSANVRNLRKVGWRVLSRWRENRVRLLEYNVSPPTPPEVAHLKLGNQPELFT